MSAIESLKPRMIAVMPTMAVMPMTMPTMVSNERILLAHSVARAIESVST